MAEDSSSPANDGVLPSDEDSRGGEAITRFEIVGLFGRPINYTIPFPPQSVNANEPDLLVLMGPNGCRKTTILRMIDGMLDLDFNMFRAIPFTTATLSLSTGDQLFVEARNNRDFPLLARFNNESAELSKNKEGYTPEQSRTIAVFRQAAQPILKNIRFQLVTFPRH
jgi:hypothetical protein